MSLNQLIDLQEDIHKKRIETEKLTVDPSIHNSASLKTLLNEELSLLIKADEILKSAKKEADEEPNADKAQKIIGLAIRKANDFLMVYHGAKRFEETFYYKRKEGQLQRYPLRSQDKIEKTEAFFYQARNNLALKYPTAINPMGMIAEQSEKTPAEKINYQKQLRTEIMTEINSVIKRATRLASQDKALFARFLNNITELKESDLSGKITEDSVHDARITLDDMTKSFKVFDHYVNMTEEKKDIIKSLKEKTSKLNNLVEQLESSLGESQKIKQEARRPQPLGSPAEKINPLFAEKKQGPKQDPDATTKSEPKIRNEIKPK